MRAIVELQAQGYEFTLDGEAVTFKFAGPGQPDAAIVRPLLEELRRFKAQAVAYLRPQAPVWRQPEAAEEAFWQALDTAAKPTVIEFGQWVDADPPEDPQYPDDTPAVDVYRPGECRPALFCGPVIYPPAVTQEQAMGRLEKFLSAVKARREQLDDAADDGDDQGKLEYLRGPHGEHDRETVWRGGLGRLPGTVEGGFLPGWEPGGDLRKQAGAAGA